MNCWDYMKCGREQDGINAYKLGVCPAYPDHGQCCAKVAGTLCGGEVQGTAAMKLKSCLNCTYFKSPHFNMRQSG